VCKQTNSAYTETCKLELSGCCSTFDILERYSHYVARATIKIRHNSGILKSLSTNLDPNEATGTIGGNFAFRIVFCNVDIMMVGLRTSNYQNSTAFCIPPFVPSPDCTIVPQSVSHDSFRTSVTSSSSTVFCQVLVQV
jgi:hypothetical protein